MSLARCSNILARHSVALRHQPAQRFAHRPYSTEPPPPPRSKPSHAQVYSDFLPGMIPVALLGSAVYLGLRLLQLHLSHERYLDEARAKVQELEREIETLRQQQQLEQQRVPHPAPEGGRKRGLFW